MQLDNPYTLGAEPRAMALVLQAGDILGFHGSGELEAAIRWADERPDGPDRLSHAGRDARFAALSSRHLVLAGNTRYLTFFGPRKVRRDGYNTPAGA